VLDRLPTDDELVELSDRWRPYRSLAVSYVFASEYETNRDGPGFDAEGSVIGAR
jgi:3-methyladenine DNA glycosylase/8-oxoguanine DNA glycosylase